LYHNTATTLIYTLSLHDALPIYGNYQWDEYYPTDVTFKKDIKNGTLYVYEEESVIKGCIVADDNHAFSYDDIPWELARMDCLATSEEHTSELQSRFDLVCRLLLE